VAPSSRARNDDQPLDRRIGVAGADWLGRTPNVGNAGNGDAEDQQTSEAQGEGEDTTPILARQPMRTSGALLLVKLLGGKAIMPGP
jgi:hypothetical protein